MKTKSSAIKRAAPEGIPYKEPRSINSDNVTSFKTSRETRAVDEMVKAYFDSLVVETAPDEIQQLIVGFDKPKYP